MKRTPLYRFHQELGGKLIEFGGWEMPVQYTSITDEHLAVRKSAGVFDISHMGEVLVTGAGGEGFLNRLLTNDVQKLGVGRGQYTVMCNEQGGVIDDLYVYRLEPEKYLLIINASRIEPDVSWMDQQVKAFGGGSVQLENVSDAMGAIALQGPATAKFIDQCFPGPSRSGTQVRQATELKKNEVSEFSFEGERIYVSRTGYTGEDGFEVVAPGQIIERVWSKVLETGRAHGLKPAGLGARDTLRTEACYPLYGHELDEKTSPIEAGLAFFVALDKPLFNGREVLLQQKTNGVKRKLVAFRMSGKSAPPRPSYPVLAGTPRTERIGEVTSGTQSPSLNAGIGMAYVPIEFAKAETPIQIEIRGKPAPAVIEKKPLYRKPD